MNTTAGALMKTLFPAIIFKQQETKLHETIALILGMKTTKFKMPLCISSHETVAASKVNINFSFYVLEPKL